MADNVKSISAKKLADEVKAAVAKNETLKALVADPKVVTIPPWIIGLILRPGDLENKPLGQVQKLAAGVSGSLTVGAGQVGGRPRPWRTHPHRLRRKSRRDLFRAVRAAVPQPLDPPLRLFRAPSPECRMRKSWGSSRAMRMGPVSPLSQRTHPGHPRTAGPGHARRPAPDLPARRKVRAVEVRPLRRRSLPARNAHRRDAAGGDRELAALHDPADLPMVSSRKDGRPVVAVRRWSRSTSRSTSA